MTLNINEMRSNAGQAVSLLRALAHEDRLILLCQLSQAEMCVSELEASLDIHQPSLSQQLGVLRREGLVSTRRQGKHIYYRISDIQVLTMLQTLHALYCSDPDVTLSGAGPDQHHSNHFSKQATGGHLP